MRRGDVVTVAATGDYGKPRPAVIVQTDALPPAHASVVICQMTSEWNDAPDFRVTIDPSQRTDFAPYSCDPAPTATQARSAFDTDSSSKAFAAAVMRVSAWPIGIAGAVSPRFWILKRTGLMRATT